MPETSSPNASAVTVHCPYYSEPMSVLPDRQSVVVRCGKCGASFSVYVATSTSAASMPLVVIVPSVRRLSALDA